jgi:hypothetical protein
MSEGLQERAVPEKFVEKGRRALEGACALGVREFAYERTYGGEFIPTDEQGNPYPSGAEVLRQIASLRIQ